MIIPIDNDHRINSDRNQWILQERRTVKGNDVWLNVAYYTSLDSIINHVYDVKLRLSNAEGLTECLAEAKRLNDVLSRALAYIDPAKAA